jgi:MFS family permease
MDPRTRSGDLAFVAVAFLGGFAFWPALIALGSLFATFSQAFGWSRSQVTTAQLIFTGVSIAGAPVIGPLIDRVGARPLLLLGLVLVPVPLALVGLADGSYPRWIAVWIAASIAGQLIAPPVWSAGIARRFGRRRGLALGLAACGFAAASTVTPLVLVRGLGLTDWRDFYFGMSGLLVVVLLPLTYLFYREPRPFAEVASTPVRSNVEAQRSPIRFGEVVASRRYLQFGLIVFLVSFVVGGMMIHLQPLFQAHGLSGSASASAYAFYGVGGIAGRLQGGWLLDRFDSNPLPALPMCVFPVLASILAMESTGPGMVPFSLVALLIGTAAGVEVDVVPYLVRRYFPKVLFGKAYLSLAAIFVGGAGASPFIVSLWYDATGSYDGFLVASTAMGLVAGFLLIRLGAYPRR